MIVMPTVSRLRLLASAQECGPVSVASGEPTDAEIGAGPARLPPAQREALTLAHFRPLTRTQVARRTGSLFGTVEGPTRQGPQRLRCRLAAAAMTVPGKPAPIPTSDGIEPLMGTLRAAGMRTAPDTKEDA
ncbi:hypothetical protein [Streptomyces stackebrandtii]|uniref:hypothetical protein n=1 Tax=Streptomyces stackebrandtii TaxID=3051177 RepID=UPI0028DC382F|nr:hypothetical protein [Streptomyces sp. DSM 40976]